MAKITIKIDLQSLEGLDKNLYQEIKDLIEGALEPWDGKIIEGKNHDPI